jgi:hypothetical protein
MGRKSLSVRETAWKLDVRLLTVYSLLWDGSIRGEKENGVWKVNAASVEAYSHRRRIRSRTVRRAESEQASNAARRLAREADA